MHVVFQILIFDNVFEYYKKRRNKQRYLARLLGSFTQG
jgi:hypothetical protein